MIIGLIIGFVILIILWLALSYNKIVNGRAKVENSWGQINVQLKKRADLIPNIVQTVSGYAKHEQETLTKVIEARNKYMTADTPKDVMDSSNQIAGFMGKLFAVAEQYPELKANQNFLDLQRQLEEIENKISMYRQFYNDTVMLYNRLLITFPKSIPASIFGFEQIPYFQVDEEDRKAPQVKF